MNGKQTAVAAAVFLAGVYATAAPAPAPRPDTPRWEYCEVQFSYTTVRAALGGAGMAGGPFPAGGRGVALVRKPTVHLVVAGEEMETDNWEALAAKLKAPAAKGKGSEAVHKLRVFNQLGRDGWELVGHDRNLSSVGDVWTFKRKAAK
jgi:hypothetical protein